MEDEKIIDLFFKRNEKAISEIDLKYRQIYHKISSNILNNNEDCNECLNDLYLSLWNTIPPKNPQSLLAFSLKILRNISINKFKYNNSKKRDNTYTKCLDELDFILSKNNTESDFEAQEISNYIDKFIKKLDYTNRLIFVRRYWYLDSYDDLSKVTGLSQTAIRTKLSRTKNKLKKHLLAKGVLL